MWKRLILAASRSRRFSWSFSTIAMPLPMPAFPILGAPYNNANKSTIAMLRRVSSQASSSSLLLECPHCRSPLARHDHPNKPSNYNCDNNHSFDVAKQDYTNLLLVQHKKSREPGDNDDMVRARTRFLSTGLYEPVSDAVTAMVQTCLDLDLDSIRSSSSSCTVIDAGCGQGYYMSRLEQSLREQRVDNTTSIIKMAAFDISKFAVRTAAATAKAKAQTTQNKYEDNSTGTGIQWFVSNSMDLPVATAQCDVLMSLFAPLLANEFGRVLKPKGHLVVASAAADHLVELRRLLYGDTNKPTKKKSLNSSNDIVEEEEYPMNKLVPTFALVSEKIIQYSIQLDNNGNGNGKDNSTSNSASSKTTTVLKDLLGMTPYQWRSSPTQQAILSSPQLLTKEQLSFTVHVRLQAFQKL